jgi:hypothetical protein
VRAPNANQASGRDRWDDLPARLRVVQDAYSDAVHDLDTVLTRPTLFDATDPVTAAFLRALDRCAQLPRDRGAPVVSWAADAAVGELEGAWQRARQEADRVGLSRFGFGDRLRVRRARRLLHKASSDRGSVPLRRGYFHRAENLLSGLIVLPDPIRAEIMEAVRKPSRIDGVIGDSGTGGAML